MLFDVAKDGSIFSNDPRIALVPEFQDLYKDKGFGERYMRWVLMVYDYDSPYAQKPLEDRILLATKDIFQSKKPDTKSKIVQAAIEKYKEIQYDALREQYSIYIDKIIEFNTLINNTKLNMENAEDLQKIMLGSEKLFEMTKRMRNSLKESTAGKKRIRGGGGKSFIENNIKRIQEEIASENG